MKKRLLSVLLATVMVATLLAGCGNSGGSGSGSEEIVTLTVLNYYDPAAPGSLEELEVVWEAFEKAHPNIKIERQDEYDDSYHQSIEAYSASGTLPDVTYAWPGGRSTTLHTLNLLKDLGPLAARDGLAANYVPVALDPTEQVGGYLGIITQGLTATNMMIANTEILSALGLTPAKTYDELVAQVPVLRDAGYETVIMPNMGSWVMQSCMYSMLIGRFMGADWADRIKDGTTDWADPAVVASIDFVKRLYDDGVLAQSSLALDYGEAPGLFANGAGAYYVDGDWRMSAFKTDAVTGEALIDPSRQPNFEIIVFPEISGAKIPARTNSVVLGTGWGMNANIETGSAKEEAAWTLIKWLTSKDVIEFRVRTGGVPAPVRTDINIAALPLEPIQIALINYFDAYDVETPVIDHVMPGPVYDPINDILQKVSMGSMNAQEAADLIQAGYEAWLATQ